ncbi:NIPSNAP family protein [Pandoraea sp. NE5]|uniref:NIPSNAP family protein n=1 Tax=Pandoraea sp. NE5 TaxID=2904129 RepID=UPI0021C444A6|nr:NIPSNAP family protein [Pandoraea sp. NE5]BDD91982.1 NIPSNAP family protein [Pandoraea sp. NE5]
MILEIRTYKCKVGTVAAFLDSYEREGLPLQVQYLGEPIGFFVSDVGPLNEVVHLWRFDSFADREARRDELGKDEHWREFLRAAASAGYLLSQENAIYRPTKFSKLR